jgi:hypothetical protein
MEMLFHWLRWAFQRVTLAALVRCSCGHHVELVDGRTTICPSCHLRLWFDKGGPGSVDKLYSRSPAGMFYPWAERLPELSAVYWKREPRIR